MFLVAVLWNKNKPTVIVSDSSDTEMPLRILTDNDFSFSFSLDDSLFSAVIDPAILTIKGTVLRISQEGGTLK